MSTNRRHFLFLLSVSTLALETYILAAEDPNKNNTAFASTNQAIQLPPLPYAYNALEPYIDTETMQLHHDKHHAAYVNNLNAALDKYPDLKSKTVEELLQNLDQVPAPIRTAVKNQGGGHVNHSLFWTIMQPNGGGTPTGDIAMAINQNFGSFAALKKQFNEAGTSNFGSAWVWLVSNKAGNLEITTTSNQDSPLNQNKYPILLNDLWEHAYYLKYHNRRADYLESWWNVVNWSEADRRFSQCKVTKQCFS